MVANITMRSPLSYNADLTPSKIFIFNDPILVAAQRFVVAKLKGALRLEYKNPFSPGLEFFPLCGNITLEASDRTSFPFLSYFITCLTSSEKINNCPHALHPLSLP